MFSQRIPVISGTAGTLNDGVFLGQVNKSPLVKLLRSIKVSSELHVIRKDTAGTSYSFVDISAEAVSDSASSFAPFGDDTTFSGNDTLYVTNGGYPISSLYFDIDVPGVWNGTGIEVWDSTDGITANRQRTIINDSSNGLRGTVGVHRVQIAEEEIPNVEFSPVPTDITSRKWYVVKLAGVTGTTTAPLCKRMWFEHDHSDGTPEEWIDFTEDINSIEGDGYIRNPLFAFPVVGGGEVMVFSNVTYGIDITISRSIATGTHEFTQEYLASDNTWKLLTVVDTSNGYESGPATLVGDSGEEFTMRWVPPADWVSKTVDYLIAGDIAESVTGFMMRQRISAVPTYGPVLLPLVRSKSRSFGLGNVEGVQHFSPTVYKGICIANIGGITADTVITVNNLTKGISRTVEVLTTDTLPLNIDFDDLAFRANDLLGMSWSSGGTITDAQIFLVE